MIVLTYSNKPKVAITYLPALFHGYLSLFFVISHPMHFEENKMNHAPDDYSPYGLEPPC